MMTPDLSTAWTEIISIEKTQRECQMHCPLEAIRNRMIPNPWLELRLFVYFVTEDVVKPNPSSSHACIQPALLALMKKSVFLFETIQQMMLWILMEKIYKWPLR